MSRYRYYINWWDNPRYKLVIYSLLLSIIIGFLYFMNQKDHNSKLESGDAFVFLESKSDTSSVLKARTITYQETGENHQTKDCLLRLRVCKEWIIAHLQDDTISEIQFSTYNSSINKRVKQMTGLRINYMRGGKQNTIDVETDLSKPQIEDWVEEVKIILNPES